MTKSAKPWSPRKESMLLLVKESCFWIGVLALAGMLTAAILQKKTMAEWHFVIFIVAASVGTWAVSSLAAMLPNRPYHGAAGLTQWRFWPHTQTDFDCRCGRHLTFLGAEFSPNVANRNDPGGGRYSTVCVCGQGHYKYKIDRGHGARWNLG